MLSLKRWGHTVDECAFKYLYIDQDHMNSWTLMTPELSFVRHVTAFRCPFPVAVPMLKPYNSSRFGVRSDGRLVVVRARIIAHSVTCIRSLCQTSQIFHVPSTDSRDRNLETSQGSA